MREVNVRYSILLPRERLIFRVESLSGIGRNWDPDTRFLVRCESFDDITAFKKLCDAGLNNLIGLRSQVIPACSGYCENIVIDDGAFELGDVVAMTGGSHVAQILFRASDDHHTVFLTEQCDNYCLMCSQPPRNVDCTYLVGVAIALSHCISPSPSVIGFSGGEPLLLEGYLREILDVYLGDHPNTFFEVLTNGRRLADYRLAQMLLEQLGNRVSWMVPLYGHADFLHDFIVQRHGAFDDTISGLLNLQKFGQPVQLRLVLIEPILKEIEDICGFVSMNLPFVQSMAFMGCEPIGFALANRNLCDIDLGPYLAALFRSIRIVLRAGIRPVIMNVPLCHLPIDLHQFAARSISNWKQQYDSGCVECEERQNCGGRFAWQPGNWSQPITHPFKEML